MEVAGVAALDGIDIESREAMKQIAECLERGEPVTLKRGAEVIGRAVPARTTIDEPTRERRRQALAKMEEIRRSLAAPLSSREILDLVHEGRRN